MFLTISLVGKLLPLASFDKMLLMIPATFVQLISSALLMTFYSVIDNIKRQEKLNIGDKGFEDGKNR